MDSGSPPPEQAARRLIAELSSLLDSNASRPETERRRVLTEALGRAFSGLPDDQVRQVVEAARGLIIAEAGERRARLGQLDAELTRTQAASAQLQQEVDRLTRENSEMRAAAPSSQAALERVVACLAAVARDQAAPAESAALTAAERRFVQVTQELLAFALGIATARREFEINLYGGGRTVDVKNLEKQLRRRFLDFLENKPGSLEAFKGALDAAQAFPVHLNVAWESTAAKGARQLLAELNPQTFVARAKRGVLGTDYPEACRLMTARHGDLEAFPDKDLIAQFFGETLQNELKRLSETQRRD